MSEHKRPGTLGLVARQVRYQLMIFLRTPRALFFILFFPMFFLVLFNALNSGVIIPARGGIRFSQMFTPAIAVFAVISATYTNVAIGVSMARDQGVLKRFRGTPLPPWIYMAGRVGSSVAIAVLSVIVMFGLSVALFHFRVFPQTLPAVLVTLLLGASAFCALGLAVTSLISSADSAPAVVNATLLPITFISGIFFPIEGAPSWLRSVASVLPIEPFARSMQAAFQPCVAGLRATIGCARGAGFQPKPLLTLAIWGLVGIRLALRTFRWEPTQPGGRKRRRLARAAA